ncbi:MAG: class B sortase [Hespellia sp.]|nr:class B sortase [Hespellia sp.]
MKKTTKILIVIGLVVLILAGAGVGAGLYMHQQAKAEAAEEAKKADPVKAEEDYNKMQEEIVEQADDPYQNTIDFVTLQKQNEDIYAWIKVPGTNIDYPVLQSVTEADDYYLNTTVDGKQGYPGSIYTEKYNSPSFTDPVTVMYGHDMKNGTMFSELHSYEDRAFFDANPYIYIYTPTSTLKYQVFAAVAFDDRYIMGSYNFSSQEDFQSYLDELRSSIAGNVNMDVPVSMESRILTLSTCVADNSSQRWLVNATLVSQE